MGLGDAVRRVISGNDCYGCEAMERAHPEWQAAREGMVWIEGIEFNRPRFDAEQIVGTCAVAMQVVASERGVTRVSVRDRHRVCDQRRQDAMPGLEPMTLRLAAIDQRLKIQEPVVDPSQQSEPPFTNYLSS